MFYQSPTSACFILEMSTGNVLGVCNLTLIREQGEQWRYSTVTLKPFRPGQSPQTRDGCLVMWTVGCGSHRCSCRPAVPSWVLTGRDRPPWPQRYPAAHLSNSSLWPLSSCSSYRWPLCSPLKATRSRFTETVWSNVSGPTAPGLGYGAFSLPSRSTWRWQVSRCRCYCCCRQQVS